jgi:cytochrome b
VAQPAWRNGIILTIFNIIPAGKSSLMSEQQCTSTSVWDLPTRVFHWINFTAIISLIFLGMIMLFKKDLGITSPDARIALKELHVIIGYVFALNLLWRIIWGFIGNKHARWSRILPGKGFGATLKDYLAARKRGEPQTWAGHNPLGRLAVTFILLLMITLAISGLVRAGTDIYYPPFGSSIAAWVAAPDTAPENIKPYDKTGTDEKKLASLESFKGPFGEIHKLAAYILMAMILLHVFFVIVADNRERTGLISAMFTGRKFLHQPPMDK